MAQIEPEGPRHRRDKQSCQPGRAPWLLRRVTDELTRWRKTAIASRTMPTSAVSSSR
jgi:hypothetical protein